MSLEKPTCLVKNKFMKKTISIRHLLILAVLGILMIAAMTPMKEAYAKEKGNVTVYSPAKGMEYSLYYIGSIKKGSIKPAKEFKSYSVDWTSKYLAETLEAYVLRDQITPLDTALVGEEETAVFSELKDGSYLLIGKTVSINGVAYIPQAIQFSCPSSEDGNVTRNIEIYGKYTMELVSAETGLDIRKIWEDEDSSERPESITVDIMQDDMLYDSVTLNEHNNWRADMRGLPGGHKYTIAESQVPEDYYVYLDPSGEEQILVNTSMELADDKPGKTPDSTPDKPGSNSDSRRHLPKTGQLWWPVLMLISFGLFFILTSMILKRKKFEA